MFLSFGAHVYKRQAHFLRYKGTLWNACCSNASYTTNTAKFFLDNNS